MFGFFLGLALAQEPVTVAELNAVTPPVERLEVVGTVARTYDCPPCPEGALCKPCMGNNIVLSDDPDLRLDGWKLRETEQVIYTMDHDQPAIGSRVRAVVTVREQRSPHSGVVHAVLTEPLVVESKDSERSEE